MSQPVVSTVISLRPKNGDEKGGVWVFEKDTPVVVRYPVESSGDNSKMVKQLIDWGDGTIEESSLLPIGRAFQSHHTFITPGEYTIKLGAVNTLGEESAYNSKNSFRVRITPTKPIKKELRRWRGLALPFKTVSDNFAGIENVFATTSHRLAEDTPKLTDDGDANHTLVIAGDADGFELGAQVTVWEDGKLLTSGRIIEATLNIIQLDYALMDDYTKEEAVVELTRENLGRTWRKDRVNKGWSFPVSFDADLIKASIASVLSIRPGERVMLGDYGSNLHEMPFEPNDAFLHEALMTSVRDAIERWEPRVAIVSLQVIPIEDEAHILLTLRSNLETFDVDFNLNNLLGAS